VVDIIGTKVRHKSFGEGTVTKFDGKYLLVKFENKKMEFVYPISFKRFLTTKNAKFKERIELDQVIAQDLAEEKKKLKEADIIALKAEIKSRSSVYTKRQTKRDSVVFKCNYCDGGKTPDQVGYAGVCSDETINHNISVINRTWCSDDESLCKKHSDGEITRKELDTKHQEGDFVCHESQMLEKWTAAAGVNKGTRKKLKRVQPDSLCILTTRDPLDKGEDERYIFAAFIIDKTFEGDTQREGYVSASSEYKIKLSQKEAHLMPFWNYHSNESQSSRAFWGSGLYRYVSNTQAAQILRDIVKIKKGTSEEELADRIFEHFCKINHIDIHILPKSKGALQLKAEEELSGEESEDLIAQ
jgi:hypothetical protein